MKIRYICNAALLASFEAVFFANAALASSGEGGGEHGGGPMEYVWKIVNFAILVFLLVKFGAKPMKGFLNSRTEMIKKSLDEAREARELAQRALNEVEDRLKSKDKEIEEILSSSRQSGEKEREALIKEGERMSQKLLEQAKSNIDFELNQAREAIKAEAAGIAMELAEKKLKDKLTEEDRKRLFDEALSRLEARN